MTPLAPAADRHVRYSDPWAGAPARTPAHLPAGDGESLTVLGQTVTVKVSARQSGGASSLFEITCPPGTGTPPHREAGDETFYVLDGTMTFLVDDQVVYAGAGECLFVPRGTRHAEANTSARPARALVLSTMGARKERLLAELARLGADGAPAWDAVAAACTAHGVELMPA
jgi:quercetin dioxygenase-like cupin family protein